MEIKKMDEPMITIGKLYLLRGSLLRKGLSNGVEFVNQAIETLQSLDEENYSLRAEVERLTPKEMTLEEAVMVLNERRYSDEDRWYIQNDLVWGCSISGFFRPYEAIAVAEKLLRDKENTNG